MVDTRLHKRKNGRSRDRCVRAHVLCVEATPAPAGVLLLATQKRAKDIIAYWIKLIKPVKPHPTPTGALSTDLVWRPEAAYQLTH